MAVGALAKTDADLRKFALAYPEAYEEFPWGHRAIKVRGKAFVFQSLEDKRLGLTVKLPLTGPAALMMPFTEPTRYGLGKSGWVTARFGSGDGIPLDLLRSWVDESYRAIAPKKLVARLAGASTGSRAGRPPSPRDRSPRKLK